MSEEKDRLGSKLRDKQRAEEDRYFAEEDRAKLEKLRATQPAGSVTLGHCPRDGTALVERSFHDVSIDECPSCGGIWLDKGELKEVIEREDEGWAHRWLRSVLSSPRR